MATEFGGAQQRVIRYLAERHGVTVLAHEFGFAEGTTLDRWLHGHGADDELDLHLEPLPAFLQRADPDTLALARTDRDIRP